MAQYTGMIAVCLTFKSVFKTLDTRYAGLAFSMQHNVV